MNFVSIPSLATVVLPLLVLTCTVFSGGLQQIAPAPYLAIALSIGYLDRLGPWTKASILPTLYLVLCIAVGTGTAFAGMLQRGDTWNNKLMAAPYAIGLGVGILNMIPYNIHLAWQRRFLPQERFQNGPLALISTLVAPTVYVAVYKVLYAVSPIGSYGSIAYTQHQIEPMAQWSSVAGISGVEFLVVWAAVIFYRSFGRYIRYVSCTDEDVKHWSDRRSESTTRRTLRRLLFSPTPTCLMVFLFVFLYGTMRHWNGDGAFYQKPLTETILPTVQASCIVGSSRYNDLPKYMNQTVELAKSGSEIVLWSETLVYMNNTAMLDSFLNEAKTVASTYGIYLGVTYSFYVDETKVMKKNMFTLIDSKGNVAFDYQKANPVAMVETTVIAGPQELPTVDTERFGRLGGAICFDLDFPGFIGQAGSKKVDLLLQPSWTWGSIGRLEATMQSYRAVENGMTLFRCSSWSPSTVYDTYRQMFGNKYNLGSGTFTVDIPLRRHVTTIYSVVGDLWAYICCALAIVAFLLVVLPQKIIGAFEERIFKKSQPVVEAEPELGLKEIDAKSEH